jgi:hypothetical protein
MKCVSTFAMTEEFASVNLLVPAACASSCRRNNRLPEGTNMPTLSFSCVINVTETLCYKFFEENRIGYIITISLCLRLLSIFL